MVVKINELFRNIDGFLQMHFIAMREESVSDRSYACFIVNCCDSLHTSRIESWQLFLSSILRKTSFDNYYVVKCSFTSSCFHDLLFLFLFFRFFFVSVVLICYLILLLHFNHFKLFLNCLLRFIPKTKNHNNTHIFCAWSDRFQWLFLFFFFLLFQSLLSLWIVFIELYSKKLENI